MLNGCPEPLELLPCPMGWDERDDIQNVSHEKMAFCPRCSRWRTLHERQVELALGDGYLMSCGE